VSARHPLKALIVCHAGVGVGLGHLTRARVVARALHQELGAQVHLLVQGEAVALDATDVLSHRFVPGHARLADAITVWVQQEAPQLVVFDLHPKQVPSDIDGMLGDLRARGCKLIAVDALASHSRFLDLVFIPGFQFRPPANEGEAATFVFGWDCFLLNVRQAPRPWRAGRNVLALSGGSDATNLGQSWPSLLNASLPRSSTLNWVTGPFAQQPVWPQTPRITMRNHIAPAGLDELMVNANYAVTVYGVSFFELLYYGVPTVVFSPYGSKDNAELQAIKKMGLAILADDETDATAKLVALMADERLAIEMSIRAKKKLAVLGGHSFAKFAAALLE
jgi:spore coat polysaccharide biosynthesis predicted glycosyltransferase SpsG